jgi:hypothetical protein
VLTGPLVLSTLGFSCSCSWNLCLHCPYIHPTTCHCFLPRATTVHSRSPRSIYPTQTKQALPSPSPCFALRASLNAPITRKPFCDNSPPLSTNTPRRPNTSKSAAGRPNSAYINTPTLHIPRQNGHRNSRYAPNHPPPIASPRERARASKSANRAGGQAGLRSVVSPADPKPP